MSRSLLINLKKSYPLYIGKKPIYNQNRLIPVIDKFTGETVTQVTTANTQNIKDAITTINKNPRVLWNLPSYERKQALLSIADQIQKRQEELARILVVEVGKSINDARGEISRAIDTFTISAEETTRNKGEYTYQDISPKNKGIKTITSKFPIGLVSMIVPFNFPVNLAAHKIGPAIATGCPFILKPSDRTPLSAVILGEILANTSLPDDSYAILPTHLEDVSIFSQDERIKLISFTGSAKVGWQIKNNAGKKKVVLELGGNAAVIIDKDVEIDNAVNRTLWGAFYSNGESCISVQRIFLHQDIYDPFMAKFKEKTSQIVMGDPWEEKTFLGPLIDEKEAIRLEEWVTSAQKDGAHVITGGKRKGSIFEPTILANVNPESQISCQEAFGPVCVVYKYSSFPEVIERVNASPYGLQAGVFTDNINKAFYAYNHLDVGGVVINDVPSLRVDSMPYGGTKDSGVGREGVLYSMEDMTETKVMVLKEIDKLKS